MGYNILSRLIYIYIWYDYPTITIWACLTIVVPSIMGFPIFNQSQLVTTVSYHDKPWKRLYSMNQQPKTSKTNIAMRNFQGRCRVTNGELGPLGNCDSNLHTVEVEQIPADPFRVCEERRDYQIGCSVISVNWYWSALMHFQYFPIIAGRNIGAMHNIAWDNRLSKLLCRHLAISLQRRRFRRCGLWSDRHFEDSRGLFTLPNGWTNGRTMGPESNIFIHYKL
jgi:hypothetical protein